MDYLHAGWRIGQPPGVGSDGLPHADLTPEPGKSLFETIEQSGLPDEQTYVLRRKSKTFALLNVYPYTSGHLMVLPIRAVASIDDLDDETYHQLWTLVREATSAARTAFAPQGLNIGLNEGVAGGGSVPDHLHVHVVPRWSADTNFMTTISDARILPVTLATTWEQLRHAWPAGDTVGGGDADARNPVGGGDADGRNPVGGGDADGRNPVGGE
ncbi:MAG: HIT domain-containing protein [Actinomycetia bacterium]|nr:HIT domain-containing protein [Actinomycetes bacterium]